MSEFIGFAYYTEVPLVICDIQRVGPSTGMPTRTQQCDIQLCAYASHGDTRHLVLFPAHPGECFEFSAKALDLAERFQTPVFFLSDIDIGMNDWMVDELTWPEDYVPDRGKVLDAEGAGRDRRVLSLSGRGRRHDPLPHPARHAPEGRLLPPWLRPHEAWPLHGKRPGIQGSRRPPVRKVETGCSVHARACREERPTGRRATA
jgi:hypothetical protein